MSTPMLDDQGNRFAQIRQALFTRFPLAIRTGHFGAVSNIPRAILLDNRGEFVAHDSFYCHPHDPLASALAKPPRDIIS